MQLADFLILYRQRHEFGIEDGTAEQYRYTATIFGAWIGRDPALEDFTDERVSLWVDWLKDRYRPATVRSQRGNLLTLWRAAWEWRLIESPPLRVRKLKPYRSIPQAWSIDECRAVLREAESVAGVFRSTKTKAPLRRSVHLRSFVRGLWDTGLRLSDLLSVERGRISNDGRLIVQQSKTGVDVLVWFSRETLDAIDGTMGDSPERRRVWPLNRRTYQEWMVRLVVRAGLCGSIKWFRRSAATACEMAVSGDGQKLLGHLQRETTRKYYLDPRLMARPVRPPTL